MLAFNSFWLLFSIISFFISSLNDFKSSYSYFFWYFRLSFVPFNVESMWNLFDISSLKSSLRFFFND